MYSVYACKCRSAYVITSGSAPTALRSHVTRLAKDRQNGGR